MTVDPKAIQHYTSNDLRLLSHGKRKNVMRNRPCICGSGKKFKQCCWKTVPKMGEENNG